MNVLVAGSSSGIGETIARQLVEADHKVALMARRAAPLESLAAELNGRKPGHARVTAGDVSREQDCAQAVCAALESLGSLDALVNAAGTWVEKSFIDAGYRDIERFVRTDVNGALYLSRAALPALKASGGRLVHINGLQGLLRQRPPVLYTTVEAAVRGLCESLRWEAAAYGVHVGLVTLGAVANAEPPDPDLSTLEEKGRRQRLSRREAAYAVLFMLSRPRGVNVDEIVLTPLGQSG